MGNTAEAPEQRFTLLYQETRDDVLAYLVRRSRTLEDATDALAETYTAAWQKLDKMPKGDRARLWLFGAARNELRMAERRTQAGNDLALELANHLRITDASLRSQTTPRRASAKRSASCHRSTTKSSR